MDTVRIQRLGYQPVTIPVDDAAGTVRIDVSLPLQAVPLDEIVVTGTAGSRARRSQPAVVAGIRAADVIDRSPASSVSDLLAARIPGISITSASGATGASSRINIRGAASLALSNEPLVFIDGVRLESQ
jgi:outer membrane cobalamin receptor